MLQGLGKGSLGWPAGEEKGHRGGVGQKESRMDATVYCLYGLTSTLHPSYHRVPW